jgi:hypothetical protein
MFDKKNILPNFAEYTKYGTSNIFENTITKIQFSDPLEPLKKQIQLNKEFGDSLNRPIQLCKEIGESLNKQMQPYKEIGESLNIFLGPKAYILNNINKEFGSNIIQILKQIQTPLTSFINLNNYYQTECNNIINSNMNYAVRKIINNDFINNQYSHIINEIIICEQNK